MKKTPQIDTNAHTFPVGEQVLIPLNRLKASPRNARKTPHSAASLEAYAASIAAKGILQNLVVEPEHEDATPTGFYLVTIGEGRRRAQNLRVERGEIPDDEPIPCVIDVRRDPQEISLDENITREAMHPADQFEAFRALVDARGFSPEDIAARFGVTARTVQERLRLSAVAPSLIQAYREEALSLGQLMAFAITDDHARQEAVFARLSSWTSEPYHIRRLLTETQVAARDRRARFVGAEAYVEAGGRIERDLFTEDDGGYFSDPALLDQLALAKLAAEAETVRAEEGWAWAQAHLDYPHGLACRRAYPQTRLLSEDEQAARHKAQADYDALYAEWSDQDEVPEDVLARFAALEADLDRFERLSIAFAPEDVARGGLIVSLAHDGAIRIERGLIRPEDAVAEVGAPDNQDDAANHSGVSGDKIRESGEDADAQSASVRADNLSADLTRDLSARRTLALRGV
ncbi:MAG TPA: ParB/RepB/Spo0J family partition protein, partial [Asticcacaulis sp.]|nr:ParB/RepB/Spo0J family partition protein [Asticcacaulis sp.]